MKVGLIIINCCYEDESLEAIACILYYDLRYSTMMTSVMRFCIFYVVVPLLTPTLTWKPSPHAVPADYRRQPADWRSRSRSRPMGWGRGGVQGRHRYGGNNYDVAEDEQQGPSVATLRMPGVYVQQVFTARCTLVQSAVLRSHVVRPSECNVQVP